MLYEPFEEVVGSILRGDFLRCQPPSVEIDFPTDRIEEDFALFSRKGFEVAAIAAVSKIIEKEDSTALRFCVRALVFQRFDRFVGISVLVRGVEDFGSGEFPSYRLDALIHGISNGSPPGNDQIGAPVFARIEGSDSDFCVRPCPEGFEHFLSEHPLFAYH